MTTVRSTEPTTPTPGTGFMEEGRFVVASTSHLTRADNNVLTSLAEVPRHAPVLISATGFGFVVGLHGLDPIVDTDAVRTSLREHGLSESFLSLWADLGARGFSLLQLDCDGAPLPGFPTFAW
ncbi:hypothetical protein E4T66_17565 [Sinimarinibacterium sp. CAU 1509]|uniref:DUF5983 family protein n=1 Tax=Sinimarinibacterium sp. CAU 1509 TaxID=2562283 RepID=UPI0010AD77CC|nr:hypothetical protein [Sinimarinibacterium sp. CAU 1509]TJY57217.1 hypothetical protein E4T66_17565 [Sinimarinibacterium sp. CAU 1509]